MTQPSLAEALLKKSSPGREVRINRSTKPVWSPTIKVAGTEVEVWNDEHFRRLREAHRVPDGFLDNQPGDEVHLDFNVPRKESNMGKGGNPQHITRCGQFIVKSVSTCDHESLLQVTEAYVQRLLTGESLLCPIYIHFRNPESGVIYVAMRNLAPEQGYWAAKYDLKGCDDDKTLELRGRLIPPVRKRFYRADMWCSCNWSKERWEYWEGKVRARALKIGLPPRQRDEIVDRIRGDAKWLIEQGLMDYSLFLAIRSIPAGVLPATNGCNIHSNGTGERLLTPQYAMLDEKTQVVKVLSLGIIDFLQPWTASKKVAMVIKSLEFNKATVPPRTYGTRFSKHFAERLTAEERLKPLSSDVIKAANSLTGP